MNICDYNISKIKHDSSHDFKFAIVKSSRNSRPFVY